MFSYFPLQYFYVYKIKCHKNICKGKDWSPSGYKIIFLSFGSGRSYPYKSLVLGFWICELGNEKERPQIQNPRQKRLVGDRHLLLQLSLWLPTGSKDLTKGDTVGTHQRLNRRRYQRIGKLFLIQ